MSEEENITPAQRLAAGYAATEASNRNLKARATAYRPEDDHDADRLTPTLDQLPTNTRLAVGYHESARTAAQQLNQEEK